MGYSKSLRLKVLEMGNQFLAFQADIVFEQSLNSLCLDNSRLHTSVPLTRNRIKTFQYRSRSHDAQCLCVNRRPVARPPLNTLYLGFADVGVKEVLRAR
jgi:hypothetical protein